MFWAEQYRHILPHGLALAQRTPSPHLNVMQAEHIAAPVPRRPSSVLADDELP